MAKIELTITISGDERDSLPYKFVNRKAWVIEKVLAPLVMRLSGTNHINDMAESTTIHFLSYETDIMKLVGRLESELGAGMEPGIGG